MTDAELVVHFAEHLPESQVAGLVSGIAAYGDVVPDQGTHSFKVTVFRQSKLPRLKEQLVEWERYGFLRWQDAA